MNDRIRRAPGRPLFVQLPVDLMDAAVSDRAFRLFCMVDTAPDERIDETAAAKRLRCTPAELAAAVDELTAGGWL
jgi:hypothetical protein